MDAWTGRPTYRVLTHGEAENAGGSPSSKTRPSPARTSPEVPPDPTPPALARVRTTEARARENRTADVGACVSRSLRMCVCSGCFIER